MKMKVGFGGGCHWCTEAIFQALKGVSGVEQGWIQSDPPDDTFSEAVIVNYDPATIPLKTLIEIHLLTHSSTSNHPLRKKYRSAIYYLDDSTQEESTQILSELKLKHQKEYITRVLPFVRFKMNEEEYLDYYKKQPEAPFCVAYIEPKLGSLMKSHRVFMK